MKKALFALAASTAMVASPAAAEVFTYAQDNGNVLTIDTDNGTGSIIGPGRNITFTSSDFSNFQGGPNPSGMFDINIDRSSTVDSGRQFNTGRVIHADGTVYRPSALHSESLKFEGSGRYSLWATWTGDNGITLGDEFFRYNGYTPPPTGSSTSTSTGGSTTGGSTTGGSTTGGSTTSTSTGGSTTGGSTTGGSTTGGSTSGGTNVPAPGVLGLMGLALAAIGLGRRRRRGAGA